MKFELTDETKELGVVTLHRIKAVKDFGGVKKDDLGGWVEKAENLSQEGYCWVFGNAQVYGNAQVSGNARVSGDACIEAKPDIFLVSNVGSENGTLTAFKCADGAIVVTRGGFYGTLEKFEEKVIETHGDNIHAKLYLALIPIIKLKFSHVA